MESSHDCSRRPSEAVVVVVVVEGPSQQGEQCQMLGPKGKAGMGVTIKLSAGCMLCQPREAMNLLNSGAKPGLQCRFCILSKVYKTLKKKVVSLHRWTASHYITY